MAKIIEKIVQSKYPPKDANVLWDDGENLKIRRNGSFENVVSTTENNGTNLDIEVTVDNTTGNPSASTTIENGTIKLAFSGLKGETGPQGNSGYQGAAGELEVVNNLVSDKPTAALSAAQGKILDAKVAQLDQRLTDVEENGGGESGMLKEDTSSNILNITDEDGNILASWDEKGGFIAKSINRDLKGIKVFCVGDSITYGQGLSSPTTQRWSAQLADMFGWDLAVKAEGGIPLSCYTANGGKTCVNFIDELASMSTKPDLILVWGGHNDTSYRPSPFGDFKNIATQDTAGALATYADRKSFCGALRYIAEVCHNYAPYAKVYFLTLLCGGASNPDTPMQLSSDKTRDDMIKAIYDAGRRYQCGVIDMGMCGINAVSGVSGNLTSDGTHPNAAGTTQIVKYLANYLNNNFVKVE